jgi:hypothetical protein
LQGINFDKKCITNVKDRKITRRAKGITGGFQAITGRNLVIV